MCHAKFQTVLASLQTQTITVPVAQHSWVLNLFRSHFKAISASAPFLCSTPSMNHEPTIPCELFRDQFRNLCKATPLAIGAVAKPVCHRGSRVLCVTHQDRHALCCLTKTIEPNTLSSFHSTYKIKYNLKHAKDVQLRAAFSGLQVQNKSLLSKWAVKLTCEHLLSKATSDMTKWIYIFFSLFLLSWNKIQD